MKAISESTGRGLAIVKADLKKEGDLGLVAMVGQPVATIGHLLTRGTAFEEQPKDPLQTKALDGTFRLQEPQGDRDKLWPLC